MGAHDDRALEAAGLVQSSGKNATGDLASHLAARKAALASSTATATATATSTSASAKPAATATADASPSKLAKRMLGLAGGGGGATADGGDGGGDGDGDGAPSAERTLHEAAAAFERRRLELWRRQGQAQECAELRRMAEGAERDLSLCGRMVQKGAVLARPQPATNGRLGEATAGHHDRLGEATAPNGRLGEATAPNGRLGKATAGHQWPSWRGHSPPPSAHRVGSEGSIQAALVTLTAFAANGHVTQVRPARAAARVSQADGDLSRPDREASAQVPL